MKGAERFLQRFYLNESVFQEGDMGAEMFVVVSGAVEIYRTQADGEELLATLKPGEMFGEMALVSEGRRFASARAAEEGTRLVCIDQARFVYLVSQQPAFALSVIRMMAERLAGSSQAKASLSTPIAEGA